MFSLSTHSHKNLSCKAVFSGSAFSMWFLLLQVQDFAIPFLELVGPFLLPFKVPLSSNTTSSHYPQFVYSASLLSVHSASPPRPLMKMNYTGSSIICWVAPLVACLHLVFMSQIIALSGGSSASFQSPHWSFVWHLLEEWIYEDVMGDSESLAEI